MPLLSRTPGSGRVAQAGHLCREFDVSVDVWQPVFRWTGLVCAAVAAAACSPTFNWRELRPEGTPLEALMPCKPESASRAVPLLGEPVELHMHSCEAGGLTFALALAEMADGVQVDAALKQWQTAWLAAIRVDPADPRQQAAWALTVKGATKTEGVKASGTDHRGQALQAQMAYFTRDGKIYQAAIYGPRVEDAVSASFFEGLVLP